MAPGRIMPSQKTFPPSRLGKCGFMVLSPFLVVELQATEFTLGFLQSLPLTKLIELLDPSVLEEEIIVV